MGDLDESPLGATIDTIDYTPPTAAADAIEALTLSQLEHALDAHRRKLRIYESLKSLNDVIGTQYGDRVLFELLQNAHDAHERDERGEIAIRLVIEEAGRGGARFSSRIRAGRSPPRTLRRSATSVQATKRLVRALVTKAWASAASRH